MKTSLFLMLFSVPTALLACLGCEGCSPYHIHDLANIRTEEQYQRILDQCEKEKSFSNEYLIALWSSFSLYLASDLKRSQIIYQKILAHDPQFQKNEFSDKFMIINTPFALQPEIQQKMTSHLLQMGLVQSEKDISFSSHYLTLVMK